MGEVLLPKMDEPSSPSGHVILQILDSWARLLKLLLIVVAIFATAWLAVITILKTLPSETNEVQFGIGQSRILLKQSAKGTESSLLVMSPQGWNRTAIQIKDGDSFKIQAGGKIHIDLTGLQRVLELRRKAEQRIGDDIKKGTIVLQPGETPEDHYNSDEIDQMTKIWAWSGPEGVTDEEMATLSDPARRNRCILRGQPYGVLVGAFSDYNEDPDPKKNDLSRQLAQAAFRVGGYYERRANAKSNGYLYLTVNDVLYEPKPQLFFMDNIGAFYVKIEVQTK
jgi:hypothetical protein